MKQASLLLVILILSIHSFSQNGTIKISKPKNATVDIQTEHGTFFFSYEQDSSSYSSTLKIAPVIDKYIMFEAEQNNIQEDQLLIQFIFNEQCTISNIVIKEKGKLNNFNNAAALFCNELLTELTKRNELDLFHGDKNCTGFSYLMKIRFR